MKNNHSWIFTFITMADMNIDEIDGYRFNGYFDWMGPGNSSGKEHFRGMYDPQTRKLLIQGHRLEDPRGNIGVGTYEAILSRNGNDFESGTWTGGGTWTARSVQ